MTGYGSHHPSSDLERGAIDDGVELVLGPNKLVSKLGEKSSSSSEFHLRKLRLDDNRINSHMFLLGCLSAVIRGNRCPCKVIFLSATIFFFLALY
jgi:hypothetical protein